MASLNQSTSLDKQKVFADQVTVNVKMQNANAVLRRLIALFWVLKLLAWIGGVKEVTFENVQEDNAQSG